MRTWVLVAGRAVVENEDENLESSDRDIYLLCCYAIGGCVNSY